MSPAEPTQTLRLYICLSVPIIILFSGCGENTNPKSASEVTNRIANAPAVSTVQSATSIKTALPTLASIKVTPSSITIAPGESASLSAIGNYSDHTSSDISLLVTWRSSNGNIVSIGKEGIATGKNFGASVITARLNDTTSGKATVSVAPTVGGRLNGLAAGNSITLTNNGADKITLTTNGTFAFPVALITGSPYDLAIAALPNVQPCTHIYGAGKVRHANVHSLVVLCGFPPRGEMSGIDGLATARRHHTGTLLDSGKVLLAGGAGATGSLASAELYDPVSGHWSATTDLNTARRDHTSTLLPDGKVLVAGGIGEGVSRLSSAEIYDPATGNWSVTDSLFSARRDHTATLLTNGKVLIAGGIGAAGAGTLASVESYDPVTGSWSAAHPMLIARTQHTATLLPDGKVLVTGGISATGSLASSELYDPETGLWSNTGQLVSARYLHTATLLSNGRVLVTGGLDTKGSLASTELYDPGTGLWTSTGSLAFSRYSHTAVLMPTGKVLVTGGTSATASSALVSTELYDPLGGVWSASGSMATARSQHTTTLLSNGKALVTGGSKEDGGLLAGAELYW